MNDLIKTILYEWMNKPLPDTIARDIDLQKYAEARPSKITAITGFRRVGKTYLLYDLIKRLLLKNMREEMLYINFEDERIPLQTGFMTALLPMFKQLFDKKIKYLFLDEIQNMPEWSKWVRRIYDKEALRIFVTGSSSKMSSKEIPTELRGRFLSVDVFPLSFSEFLRFSNMTINAEAIKYSEEERAKLSKAIDEFLTYGSMPEVVLANKNFKFEIVNSYYQSVVRRDIIERHDVRNEESLKALLRLLLNSTSYSISKVYNTLKSLGYKVGKSTVQSYLSHVENAYFMFSLPLFSYKIKNQMQYARKLYVIDNGFINKISTKLSNNYGRLFENAVAIHLVRTSNGKELYYWKSTKEEVDFVVKQGTKVKQLIQVCYDATDVSTRERETRALIKASKELGCRDLSVITNEYESMVEEKWFGTARTIKFIPLWKWLLAKF